MIQILKILSLLSFLLGSCAPLPTEYEALQLQQKPFNQLDLARNACGPAALLNASRFGSKKWNSLSTEPKGLTDRERIRRIARGSAMQESSSLPGRARWSKKGINLTDLGDVANELARDSFLQPLTTQTLFLKPNESQSEHLQRVHSLFVSSFRAGFPPVISLRRYVYRQKQWTSVHAHFVTLASIPGQHSPYANSFPVKYIDPWGGKIHTGEIAIASEAIISEKQERNPNLLAKFPNCKLGTNSLKSGETSFLLASGCLVAF